MFNRDELLIEEEYKITPADGIYLDTIKFVFKKDVFESLNEKEKKNNINYYHQIDFIDDDEPQYHIIFFNGYGYLYEYRIEEMKRLSLYLHCTCIGFNYRNSDNAENFFKNSAHDLMMDGIAQVNDCLKKKIPANKIILNGFSIGGAIATLTAKYFHDRNKKVNLFNDRSFNAIANVIVEKILNTKDEVSVKNWTKKIFGYILKTLISFALWLKRWEMNVIVSFKQIPNDCKEYIYVIPSENKVNNKTLIKMDHIISQYATLHSSLDNNEFSSDYNRDRGMIYNWKITNNRRLEKTNIHSEIWDCLVSKNNPSITALDFFSTFFMKIKLRNWLSKNKDKTIHITY